MDDVAGLLDALGLERSVLLGFCIGGPVAAGVAGKREVAGLVLLESAIGSRQFLEERGTEAAPEADSLERRFRGVDDYLRLWRAENPRYSDEAERWVERFARFELAPLADGTFRRRGLRQALWEEFGSILASDTLGALAAVTCPVLVVRAMQSWMGRGPWMTGEAAAAQVQACRVPSYYEAPTSHHASAVRDPEPALIERIQQFARTAAGPA